MASEYLNKQYLGVKGFSPRSIRRMRAFYLTYEDHAALLSLSMQSGWTQNVVIMEANLTMDLRKWYMKAVLQFGWSKIELIINIEIKAHNSIATNFEEDAHLAERNTDKVKYGIVILKNMNRCKRWISGYWFLLRIIIYDDVNLYN